MITHTNNTHGKIIRFWLAESSAGHDFLNIITNFNIITNYYQFDVALNWFRCHILHAFNSAIRFDACKMERYKPGLTLW